MLNSIEDARLARLAPLFLFSGRGRSELPGSDCCRGRRHL